MSPAQRATILYGEFTESVQGPSLRRAPLTLEEIRLIAEAVQREDGRTLESNGERLYALFPRAASGLSIARVVLEVVERARRAEASRAGLSARLLLGYGDISFDAHGRLQGDWSYKFSRICSHLPAQGIGALDEYVAHAGEKLNPLPRPGAVAGLFVISGEEAPETRMGSSFAAVQAGIFNELHLKVRGTVRVVRPVDCPLLVGRDKSCGVQVSSDTASRIHGRIEYDNSKFFYVDQSRNGSYVLNASGQEVHLANGENLVLAGEGAISTGSPIAEQKGEVVRYKCQTTKLSLEMDSGDTKTFKA